MLCRKCGATFSQGDSFCAACGYDLGATALLTALAEHAERPAVDIVRDALQGEYDVKTQIGRGGMGIVFHAVERTLNREVALKVLPFAHVHDSSLVERFTNEARTAAKLEHPNIVPVYRVGRSGDVIYFTMRYLTGPSLAELIVETGDMAPRDIRRILIECAEALGYAHRHGVVHRDVKPDNVMFKESGEVVVCDFGIARAASGGSLTGTGMAIGTPYYMSPEQFRARPLDGRSDIYSLGVVAYQCLTKDLPFLGEDSFSIGYKHVTEALPIPTFKTGDHRALYDVVVRMMAKEPEDRYPDTQTLIQDLQQGASSDRSISSISTSVTVVDGLSPVSELPTVVATPVESTPATPLPRSMGSGGLRRPGRRPPPRSGVGIAAFTFLVLGGIGGGGFWFIQSSGGAQPALDRARISLQTQLARVPWFGSEARIADTLSAPPENVAPVSESLSSENPPTLGDWLGLAAVPGDTLLSAFGLDSAPATVSDTLDHALAVLDTAFAFAGTSTGALLVEGVGSGQLTINGETRSGVRHFLPEGAHELTVTAPGYAPYSVEIIVQANRVVRHRVQMVRTSHCESFDPNYNALGECFDEQPVLAEEHSLLVPLDETVTVVPTLPADLAVLVRADGLVGLVQVVQPSDVDTFTVLALQYAKTLRFQPGRKLGQSVDAWIRLQLYARQ